MSRPWRIALVVVAVLVAVNLALRFLGTLTGGTPGGPRSSSYATSPRGDAAYAELLGRAGHPVEQVRSLPHSLAAQRGRDGVPPRPAGGQDDRTSRRSGRSSAAAGASSPPACRRQPCASSSTSVPKRARARATATDGLGRDRRPAVGVTRLVARGGSAAARRAPRRLRRRSRTGSSVPADNAAFGLALAGPRNRPVEFLESYHGYGTGSGLVALCRSPGSCCSRASACRRSSTWSPAAGASARPRRRAGSRAAAPRVRRLARRGPRPEQAPRRRRRARAARGPRRHPPPGVAAAGRRRPRRPGRGQAARPRGRGRRGAAAARPRRDAEVLALGRVAARIRQDHR